MLAVAVQLHRPALAGCSSDGGKRGAPLNSPTPGTHCQECWRSPGQR